MTKKSKAFISLLATMGLAVTAGVVALNTNVTPEVSVSAASTEKITFEEGASIRLSNPTGIRYTATLDSTLLNTTGDTVTFADGVTVGMLIVPAAVIENATDDYIAGILAANTGKTESDFTTTFTAEQIQSKTVSDVTTYYVCGAITGITDEYYDSEYRAVAYYKQSGSETVNYSAKSDKKTIAYVADQTLYKGVNAKGTPLTGENKTTLGDILEKSVAVANPNGVSVSGYVGQTADLNTYFADITGETYAVTAGTAATVDGGVVTFNEVGTATITVTAYEGNVSIPVTVTVKEPTQITSTNVSETEVVTAYTGTSFQDAALTSTASSFTLDMSDKTSEIAGTLKSVTVDGTTYTENISYADGKVTVNETVPVTTYGEKAYTALFENESEQIEVSGKTLFITLKISNVTDLGVWATLGHLAAACSAHENTRCSVNGYFVMDNDITCTTSMTTDAVGNWLAYCFDGVFDGCGYNIDGYNTGSEWHSFIYRLGEYGTIRNISFTNVDRSKTTGALLLNENWGEDNCRTIENIYVHYNNFLANGKPVLVGGSANDNIAYKNIVVTATSVSGETATSVANTSTTNAGNVKNVYAIGLGDNVKINTTDTESVRNDKDIFATYANKAAAANNDYTAMTATDFWKLDSDGIPNPKNLEAMYAVKFVVDGTTVSDTVLFAGSTLTVPESPTKSGYAFAGWKLGDETTAYDFDAMDAKVVSSDMTFTALWEASVESAKVSETEIVTAIANAGTGATVDTQAQAYTIDVSDVAPTTGEITALTVGTTTYALGEFSYASGVITVNKAPALSTYGLQNYTAKFSDGSSTTVVTGKTLFITMVIETADEFNSMGAIGNAVYQANGGSTAGWYQGYFTLGANI